MFARNIGIELFKSFGFIYDLIVLWFIILRLLLAGPILNFIQLAIGYIGNNIIFYIRMSCDILHIVYLYFDAEPATINDETLSQPGSLPLEEMCSGKPQNVQEGCEATQISEDNNSGQASEPNAISEFLNKTNLEVRIEF